MGIYWQSLQGGLIWDDGIVQKNQMVYFKSVKDAFFFDHNKIYQWSPHYYRPMVTLSYMLDEGVSKYLREKKYLSADPLPPQIRTDPRVSHGSCILYHAITTFFVWMFTRQLLSGRAWMEWGALISGLVFAVHPIHTETVSMINGRSDSLAAMFMMPGVVAAMRFLVARSVWALLASGVLFFAAILTKEVGLSAALLLPFLAIAARGTSKAGAGKSPSLRAMLARLAVIGVVYGAAIGGYFWLRGQVEMQYGRSLPIPWSSLGERFVGATAYYMGKLVWPWPQCHFTKDLPDAMSVGLPVAAGLLALGVFAIVRAARGKSLLLTALAMVLCTLAPSMAIALRGISETPVAERYLYLPTAGLGIAMAGLLGLCWSRVAVRALAMVVMLGVCGGFAYGTWERGKVWLDDVALWRDAARQSPDDGLPWFSLGMALFEQKKLDEALECFDKSIKSKYDQEGYSLAWNSKGAVLMSQSKMKEALLCFGESIRIRPTYHTPYFNVGRIMMVTADEKYAKNREWDVQTLERGLSAFDMAIKNYAIYTWAYLERGKCKSKLAAASLTAQRLGPGRQRLEEAAKDFEMVVRLDGSGRFGSEAQTMLKAVRDQLAKLPATQPADGP